MNLTEAQSKIARDLHRFRVLACGRKFGKTTLFLEEMVGAAVLKDNQRIMYMAPTLGDARSLIWDRLTTKLGRAIIWKNDTLMEMKVHTVHGGKSEIFLGSWEKVQNYRGLEYDFLLLDEVQDYRGFWVDWQQALRPTLTPRQGSALFAGTPKGFNHFYDLYNFQYTDTDYASFKFTSYDNPNLPVEEIEKAKKELTDDSFSQEYLAEFRKSEGLVFKEFDRSKHLYQEPLHDFSETLGAVDWGFTNPTAVLDVKVKGNNFYVSGELYRPGMTDEETADYVANKRYAKVYPDPAQPASIETMRRKGINIREVKKGADSIQHGINTIRELFKQNRLFIEQSCVNLIEELETYSYADKRIGHNENEKPVDEYNHAIDALRYVLDNHVMSKPFMRPPIFNDQMEQVWRGR